jgi:hypothetical protein
MYLAHKKFTKLGLLYFILSSVRCIDLMELGGLGHIQNISHYDTLSLNVQKY